MPLNTVTLGSADGSPLTLPFSVTTSLIMVLVLNPLIKILYISFILSAARGSLMLKHLRRKAQPEVCPLNKDLHPAGCPSMHR